MASANRYAKSDQFIRSMLCGERTGLLGNCGNSLPSAIIHKQTKYGGIGLESVLAAAVKAGIQHLQTIIYARRGTASQNPGILWLQRQYVQMFDDVKNLKQVGAALLHPSLERVKGDFLTIKIKDLKVVIPAALIESGQIITQNIINFNMGLCSIASDLTALATAEGALMWNGQGEVVGIVINGKLLGPQSSIGEI